MVIFLRFWRASLRFYPTVQQARQQSRGIFCSFYTGLLHWNVHSTTTTNIVSLAPETFRGSLVVGGFFKEGALFRIIIKKNFVSHCSYFHDLKNSRSQIRSQVHFVILQHEFLKNEVFQVKFKQKRVWLADRQKKKKTRFFGTEQYQENERGYGFDHVTMD